MSSMGYSVLAYLFTKHEVYLPCIILLKLEKCLCVCLCANSSMVYGPTGAKFGKEVQHQNKLIKCATLAQIVKHFEPLSWEWAYQMQTVPWMTIIETKCKYMCKDTHPTGVFFQFNLLSRFWIWLLNCWHQLEEYIIHYLFYNDTSL